MGAIPAFFLRHEVTVEPYLGSTAHGPKYGPARPVRAFVDHKRRMVRAPDKTEVVSETTVYLPPDTDCPTGSRVTLPSGAVSTVLVSSPRDGGGLPVPDHLEVNLQ